MAPKYMIFEWNTDLLSGRPVPFPSFPRVNFIIQEFIKEWAGQPTKVSDVALLKHITHWTTTRKATAPGFQCPLIVHAGLDKCFLIHCQIPPRYESPLAQISLHNQCIHHQLHEPGARERSHFFQGLSANVPSVQQWWEVISSLWGQIVYAESHRTQWAGWKARSLVTWVLVLTLPRESCGKTT